MSKDSGKLIAAIEAIPLTLLLSIGFLWWAVWPGIATGDGGDPPLYSISVSSSAELEAEFELSQEPEYTSKGLVVDSNFDANYEQFTAKGFKKEE